MASWIIPTIGYVLLAGSLGVTTKFALRAFSWDQLVVWAALAYVGVAVILIASGTRIRFHGGLDGAMAGVSALIAPTALIVLFIALRHGDAGRVIPVSSAYPLVTVALAAIVLSEAISEKMVVGIALIVIGVVLLSL